jgi:tetratricopeptide (TPR) repeat protein
MNALRWLLLLGLLTVSGSGWTGWPATAQTTAPKEERPSAPGAPRLTGNDARRATELSKAIETALEADRWDEAMARVEELVALRRQVLGPTHFQTVNDEWRLKSLQRVAPLPADERAAYRSVGIMNRQAFTLDAQGKYAQAQPLYEKALEITRRLLSDDHPQTAAGYNNVAYNLRAQRKYAQAQPLSEKALEIQRRLLSDEHPDTATSYNNVAYNLKVQGKYAQAQPLYEKALEIRRRVLSDDHPDTATSYNNVAYNLKAQGKYAAAQPLFEKALEIRRRRLGDDHPDTAASYDGLAENLDAQGKYAQAQPLYEKALAIRRRILSDDHPSTATSYNNVAYNLKAQGQYAAAQPLFEKALEIRRRRLGDDHPETAYGYNNVASNLAAQGQYAAAQPLFEKALGILRRVLSDDHPDTAYGYNNVAYNLNAQGQYAAAQPLYEKALEIRRRLLSDDHPSTALSYNNVAVNLNAQGQYAAAQPLFEKALEIYRRLLGDDHPETAASYSGVAKNLNAQGQYAAAQPLFEKALEITRRRLGDDHPETGTSYNNLAHNLNSQGQYAAAQPLHEKALEIYRRLLGDDHPETANSYNNVAVNLNAQGQYAAAQPLYEKALEIRRRLLGDDHPDTALSYNNVAYNLNAQGQYAAAQPLFEKALEIRRRLLGDDHPDTARTYNNVAYNLNAQGRYGPARDQWLDAVRSRDTARLRVAFRGLERAGTEPPVRLFLAAVQARLDQPAEAWQALEEDLGRGLLDELAARRDRRLTSAERGRLQELTRELEQLDRLVEAIPRDRDQAGRTERFEALKRRRAQASIALGEFQARLVEHYGPLAGKVARRDAIQTALPGDAALVAWVDLQPAGRNEADPDGAHWGVVVRARGIPAWIALAGTGRDGLWTRDDTALAGQVRTRLRSRPGASADPADLPSLLERLRAQRLGPLAGALGATADGLPAARRLVVLPSRDLAGIPIEALLAPDDTRTVSYAPSATVLTYLREQSRPDRHAGLLVLGDPIFAPRDPPSAPGPLPDHGLLVNQAVPGSNAAAHGLKRGDVLMAYNGRALNRREDLVLTAEGDGPIAVALWREGRFSTIDIGRGPLGLVFDRRPAPEAIAANRELDRVLLAARTGNSDFAPLPGTRFEAEALAQLFQRDDRSVQMLLGADASERALDRLAASGDLARLGFIHLATHGVIDEDVPSRSAVILTQTDLPDPLDQVLRQKPVFDGRLSVREIQRTWELKAELVTLSACETALGRESGGEGFVGFSQALLMSGTRSVCLSLWKVDDLATALLMDRFYANLLGCREGLAGPLAKAEALREAKAWLSHLSRAEVVNLAAKLSGGEARSKGAPARRPAALAPAVPPGEGQDRPYAEPYYWAAFVLIGDPD